MRLVSGRNAQQTMISGVIFAGQRFWKPVAMKGHYNSSCNALCQTLIRGCRRLVRPSVAPQCGAYLYTKWLGDNADLGLTMLVNTTALVRDVFW